MAKSAIKVGNTPKHRFMLFLLSVGLVTIIGRLIYLQYFHVTFLHKEGMNRSLRIVKEAALRGIIFDRNGEPLAVSTPTSNLILNPRKMWEKITAEFEEKRQACHANDRDGQDDAKLCPLFLKAVDGSDQSAALREYALDRMKPLAEMLNEPVQTLYGDLFKRRNKGFYYLARNLSPHAAEEILNTDFPELERQNSYQRFYPSGAVTGQVVGYTDVDERGQEGVERVYDDSLAGEPRQVRIIQDRGRNVLRVVEEIKPASPGSALYLSIDKRIQFVMYTALKKVMAEFKPASASAVMVDIKTGEILGMLSLPVGNPNNPTERAIPELMTNHVMTDVFEPGSTMKPVAMASALDAGLVSPNSKFDTHGVLSIGQNTVRDTHNYGLLDAVGVIRKSSNVGMSMLSRRVPRYVYQDFLAKMGFGQKTGVRFPSEADGVIPKMAKLNDFGFATSFFGYSLNVTTLQLASAYATFANDGVKVPLTLLRRDYPVQGKRVMKQKTAHQIQKMLEAVVETGGTGTHAQMASYTLAGKTGTSHKVIGKQYAKDRYYGVFAGYAPFNHPRIAMVVLVDDPQGEYYGGLVAAPAWGEIAEWSLRLLGVLPDKIATTDKVDLQFAPQGDEHEAQ